MTSDSVSSGWAWLKEDREPAQILGVDRLWSSTFVQLYLPESDRLLRLPHGQTDAIDSASQLYSPARFSFAASAARILDALDQSTLLAPLETSVIPLPHQLYALGRAMSADSVRFLLADEVGLGKTIEAGLIMRELKLRGLVRRVLVVAPAGLVNQWVSEMDTHFSETFQLVIPADFSAWRRVTALSEQENLWELHDQVVVPLDSVKPMEGRQGWSQSDVARYNRERFEDLVTAGWDLIVVDEAHRMAGSTPQIARHRLGEALSQASPYLLLLTATPHQGKTDGFRRLVSFIDADAVPDEDAVRRENISPLVIRTEKRRAIDQNGKPLFLPRRTELIEVTWSAHHKQQAVYEAVTEYVREGYNQAIQNKQTAVGFLMLLMQRLVTSSTAAIRTALERRLEVLELPEGQLTLFGEDIAESWTHLDSEDQLRSVLGSRLKGLRNERREVELLLSAARQCEAESPDTKAEVLLEQVRRLQREDNEPLLKVLIFTEFIPTQSMLVHFLEERGFSVTALNGSLSREERLRVQREFAGDTQILVSTDAGGEGLNLQFCHAVINYDLPWNPMKLEQRIGRVDRIGQHRVVRALNLALENSVELRVREVLEEKLARILEEFGVDKLSDVLDSEEQDIGFDRLYATALMTPEEAEEQALGFAEELKRQAEAARQGSLLLGSADDLDPAEARQLSEHQLPYWTERLTLGYLGSHSVGGADREPTAGYHLHWPDRSESRQAVFSRREAEDARTDLITLDDPRLQEALRRTPVFVPGQPVAHVRIAGIPDELAGLWSLWRIRVRNGDRDHNRCFAIFQTADGKLYDVAARQIWDRVVGADVSNAEYTGDVIQGDEAVSMYERGREAALASGGDVFSMLAEKQQDSLVRESKKMEQSFAARRRAVERVGLPQVRDHRLRELEEEERTWNADFESRQELVPELHAVLLLHVSALTGVQ